MTGRTHDDHRWSSRMKDDPRIAILTQFAPSKNAGGVEVFNEFLRRALGHVEIFADGLPEDRVGGFRRVIGLEQPAEALRAARILLRRHREEPFDLILSNGLYGWPLTIARPGVPLVEVYHCTMAGFANHVLNLRSERLAQGHVMALFDRLAGIGKHVVVVSHRVLREVESFYGLKGRLMPHAVDTATFRPMNSESARESLGLPENAPIGLFVGRPDSTKGFDILTGVARRMQDVAESDYVDAIRLVLATRGQFSPRQYVLPRYDFGVFRAAWRDYIGSVIGEGS